MRDRAVGRVAGLRAAGGVMLVAVVAFALVWPAIAPADMASSGYLSADLAPTWAHPMGTDGLGHDLSVRVAQALRVSLAVAAGAAVLAGVLGVAVGAGAAACGGRVDAALMRCTDAVAAVPHLLATVVVVALFRGSLAAIVVALALTHWPAVARVVRAEAQQIMASQYVAASRVAGASPLQLARWHVLPAVVGQAGLAMVLMIPHAVWHESTLSFLGIGMPPERPSLGTLVALSQSGLLLGRWWPLAFPTAALIAVTVAVALLGPGTPGRGWVRRGSVRCRAPVGDHNPDDNHRDDDDEVGSSRASLTVDDLVVAHRGPGSVRAVDGASLRIETGRVVAIIGPSGAGKSSLLDACAGMTPAGAITAGRVAPGSGGSTGHVPQSAAAAFTPTRHLRGQLEEGLAVGRRGRGDRRAPDVDALCRLVRVNPALADRYPHQLSGGQLRRMAIAAALSTNPTVLLADEPTTGLDADLALAVLTTLRRLADDTGLAVLLVTHDHAAIAESGVADEVLEMRGGRLRPVAELVSS
ncbi:ATP-binding cassette domain-containing protein [Dietzia maris]|uniref:ATP-binding cassette domain-containing protein n=1 Tax=Dietzia maris TaxID=37915 RepID=UPI0021AEAFC7|nr:ATP-binding cassette domain-containing protein [Dietzia maris]MCT1433825.1 ATP-binding cassette domain-containing protein [Dietzia maris]MCT1521415.1 ATP-binding cassette domain-containing protein [Dietzia maris]